MKFGWPLPNVWLGTSVEDQKRADERIPHLLRCPASVRFLSVEPLLGAMTLPLLPEMHVNTRDDAGVSQPLDAKTAAALAQLARAAYKKFGGASIDWIIVGGESGSGARPMNVEWARSIVRQCKEAGVSCFVKQLGAKPIDDLHRRQIASEQRPYVVSAAKRAPYDGWNNVRAFCTPITQVRDPKGGDPAEWPEDLRISQMPALRRWRNDPPPPRRRRRHDRLPDLRPPRGPGLPRGRAAARSARHAASV
jgi:hypothetical protein